MSHSVEHHIEHAEHAAHAAHDEFNTRVTISIAIIAAALAGVSILGHRAHNAVLLTQQEATMESNKAANKWAYYQAVNIRSQFYLVELEAAEFNAREPETGAKRTEAMDRWRSQRKKYEDKTLKDTKHDAEEHEKKSAKFLADSAHWHHRTEWLDLGNLGLQLGVVFATLAILSKRRVFWFSGIAIAIVGLSVSLAGQFDLIPAGHHEPHGPADHKTEAGNHKSDKKTEPAKH